MHICPIAAEALILFQDPDDDLLKYYNKEVVHHAEFTSVNFFVLSGRRFYQLHKLNSLVLIKMKHIWLQSQFPIQGCRGILPQAHPVGPLDACF
uniref:Uncharacterized protein n=1 Tax=Anguilla anguilla TaxID=7936 RepID=A0A0E9RGC0_ANGAN